MTYVAYRHCAYNLDTGELVASASSRGLNLHVRSINRYETSHGYDCGRWLFGHHGFEALSERIQKKGF